MMIHGHCCRCGMEGTDPTCNLIGYNRTSGEKVWVHGGYKAVPTYNDTVVCLYPKTTEEWDLQSVWVYKSFFGNTTRPPDRLFPLSFPEYQPYNKTRDNVTTWEWVYRFIDIGNGIVTDLGTSHLEVSNEADRLDQGDVNTFPNPQYVQNPEVYQVLGDYQSTHISIQSRNANWYFLNAYDLTTSDLEYWIDPWPARYQYTIKIPAYGTDGGVTLYWDQTTTPATIQSELNAVPQIVSATATCTGTDLSDGRTVINISWPDPSLTITQVLTEYLTGEGPGSSLFEDRGTAYLLKAADSTIVTSRALGRQRRDPYGGDWRGVLMEGGDLLEYEYETWDGGATLRRLSATDYGSVTWSTSTLPELFRFTLGSSIVLWGYFAVENNDQRMVAFDYDGTATFNNGDFTGQVFSKILHQVDDSDIAKNYTTREGATQVYASGDVKPQFNNRYPLTVGADLSAKSEAMNLGSQHMEMVGSSTAALFAIRTLIETDTPGETLLAAPVSYGYSGFQTAAPFPVPGYYWRSWTVLTPPNYRVSQNAATEYRIELGYLNLEGGVATEWISATANKATVEAALEAAFGTHTGTPSGPVMTMDFAPSGTPVDTSHATSDPLIVHDYMLWQDFVSFSTYRMQQPDASSFGLLDPTFVDQAIIKIRTRNTFVVIKDLVSRVDWTDGLPDWESSYGIKLDGTQGYPRWGFMTDLSNVLAINGDDVACAARLFLDPNGNGAIQDWDINEYTRVNDAVRAPNAPTTGPGQRVELEHPADGEIVQWTCENVPSTAATSTAFRLWVHDPDSTAALFGVRVRIDSVWQAQQVTTAGTNGDWDYWDFISSTDLSAGVTGMGIELEAEGTTDDFYVDAAYIEVLIV